MSTSKQSRSILRLDVTGLSDGRSDYQDRLLTDEIVPGIRRCAEPAKPAYAAFLGESAVLLFEDPVAAAKSALSIRDFFRNTNWGNLGASRLSARIGLHCGLISLGVSPGQADVLIESPTTRMAKSLADACPSGQVLASETFATTLQEALRAENDDTLRIERAYAVRADAEPSASFIAWRQETAIPAVAESPPRQLPKVQAAPPAPESARPVGEEPRAAERPQANAAQPERAKLGVVMVGMAAVVLVLLVVVTLVYTHVQELGLVAVVTATLLFCILFVVAVALFTGRLSERLGAELLSKLLDRLPGRK